MYKFQFIYLNVEFKLINFLTYLYEIDVNTMIHNVYIYCIYQIHIININEQVFVQDQ